MSAEGESDRSRMPNRIACRPNRGTPAASGTPIEHALERIGDRLNPILVKETRQALKSRQFLITFALLLFLGWGWSILGIAMIGPGASVGTYGGDMFIGLLRDSRVSAVDRRALRRISQPGRGTGNANLRTAFDHRARHAADRPRQAGQRGAANVGLSLGGFALPGLYLSAPRNRFAVDLHHALLADARFAGPFGDRAVDGHHHAQEAVPGDSDGRLDAGLFLRLRPEHRAMSANSSTKAAQGCSPQWEFWAVNGAILTGLSSPISLMVCEASAARLSFASDNRSTPAPRHHGAAPDALHRLDGHSLDARKRPSVEIYLVFMILAGIQWYFLGALMIGESPDLSSRVKRQLPQSFLGRMFLTWFYPGPGKGYMLALTGLICTLLTACIGMIVAETWSGGMRPLGVEE